MSYLELAKRIQARLDATEAAPESAPADATEGEIIAVLIKSTVLDAEIWFALRDDFKPGAGDTRAVYFAGELPFLRTKSTQSLKEIQTIKLCGPAVA